MAIEVVRIMTMACQTPRVSRITIRVNDKVAAYDVTIASAGVMQIEEETRSTCKSWAAKPVPSEHFEIDCRDDAGNLIDLPFLEDKTAKK